MNEHLIKFIELCLEDGVITNKEREVIFRKAKEFGVPDDECEIIIDSLVSRHTKKLTPVSKESKSDLIKENYYNQDIMVDWFKKWLEIDDSIKTFKEDSCNLFRKAFLEFEIDKQNPFNNKNKDSPKFISKERLFEIMDLSDVEGQQGRSKFLWIKEVPHIDRKIGGLENKFKDILMDKLENEEFICYLSYSEVGDTMFGYLPQYWFDRDFEQMIKYYNNPEQEFDKNGWHNIYTHKDVFLMRPRKCVLITNQSILELEENKSDYNLLELDKIDVDVLLSKTDEVNAIYEPILVSILKSKHLNIDSFKPIKIEHDSNKFMSIIEAFQIDNHLKRILNVDYKIRDYIDSIYNNQLKLIADVEMNYFQVKQEKNILGKDVKRIKVNPVINVAFSLSLEVFSNYIHLLKFRDSLLNKYLNDDVITLETDLQIFEDSYIGMSNFQKTSLSELNSIKENLIHINETLIDTKRTIEDRFDALSCELSELGINVKNIESLNKQISNQLSLSNFLSSVSLYQQYKINKNTKG